MAVLRINGHGDAAYHRWGGHKPGMLTSGYKSPLRYLVGKTVILTRDVTTATGEVFPAGTRATVARVYRGLTLSFRSGAVVERVDADAVRVA